MRPLLLLALLTGCAAAVPEAGRLDGIDWKLVEVNGAPYGHDVSLRIDGDRLSGIAPCNAYSGAQDAKAPAFAARRIGSTRMACANPARAKAEAEYLALLPKATQISRDRAGMVLAGPGLNMRFVQREARGDEVL